MIEKSNLRSYKILSFDDTDDIVINRNGVTNISALVEIISYYLFIFHFYNF